MSAGSLGRGCTRFGLGLGLAACLASPWSAWAGEARRVAVVVGISAYGKLPADLEIPSSRKDARNLAGILEDEAGFDEVHLLLDGVATRDAVMKLLLETLPAKLDGDDTLLVYFTGHGVGGDFDDPYLLPYDADPADLQGSSIGIRDLGTRVQKALNVGSLVLVTDAAHPGLLNGMPLIGPTAKSWPQVTDNFFALSATSAQEVPPADLFGPSVADGLRGRADVSGDGLVTASELHRFVLDRMIQESKDQVHPSESGKYPPSLVVSRPSAGGKGTAPASHPADDRTGIPTVRWIGGGCVVGAAVSGGLSLKAFLEGRRLSKEYADIPVADEAARETKAAEFRSAKTRNYIFGGVGGVLLGTGVGLLVVPVDKGAMLTATVTF